MRFHGAFLDSDLALWARDQRAAKAALLSDHWDGSLITCTLLAPRAFQLQSSMGLSARVAKHEPL
jgi:hypothetical protein